MLLLKGGLVVAAIGLLLGSLVTLLGDIYRLHRGRIAPAGAKSPPIRWSGVLGLGTTGLVLAILAAGIVLVPAGRAGVRVSQLSGVRPGTLYPGLHLVVPFVETVPTYDTREHVLTTLASEDPKKKTEVLRAQSREGLGLGLLVSVRYRLDPRRLDYIHANLPESPEEELVPPVVGSTFREIVPAYLVKEVFATKREEVRATAAERITRKLEGDGIIVKEVMLRDVVLPPQYAAGLEGLLLKEQENERLVYELQVKEKEVRAAELEAEAQKARDLKAGEAQAELKVMQAKAEADAMQHTLPLKEKQIQQTRLEAEARKEATLMNADAAAQAKVIESRADADRDRLMADAEANRIRVTSLADSERMKLEAAALKDNPLLIQKIVAEKLSDKMQIMMVPMDGRYFFANDIFRGVMPQSGGGDEAPKEALRTAQRRP
jgi:regulator of protease activity HflC (stomatin/prohibitin superfamily)